METEDSSRATAYGEMRRQDRSTDDAWIRSFLHRAPYGVVATTCDGQPFITPNTFVFDEAAHTIYVHTAVTGQMRANIDANANVCFCAAEMGRLLPAAMAMEFSVEYASVIAYGSALIVTDPSESGRALQKLMDKYFPHLHSGRDYRPISQDELDRTAVFRIDIGHWTGKAKRELNDSPGAFHYHA